jgi:hypothetical protein
MRPPTPDAVASVFAEAKTGRERLVRLVEELDAFYARGAHRLALAARDRDLVPELDGFLSVVEVGVEALVREALAHTEDGAHVVQVAVAFTSFQFWMQFTRVDLAPAELTRLKVKILEYALKAARQVWSARDLLAVFQCVLTRDAGHRPLVDLAHNGVQARKVSKWHPADLS